MATYAPDIWMSPKHVTGKCAVRNCSEAYTEWNYNAKGCGCKDIDE
jgi:hypothetical protein